jgi:hypothetical protein
MQEHRLAIEIEQQGQRGSALEASEAGIDDRHLVVKEHGWCMLSVPMHGNGPHAMRRLTQAADRNTSTIVSCPLSTMLLWMYANICQCMEAIGFSTMSLFIGPSAPSSSFFSRSGTLNLLSVATRSPTSASKSLLLTPMPAWVAFMLRPV